MVAREHLLLDPAIRDWVVIPMVILLVLVALGRNYVSQLIKSTPDITENDLDELRFKQTLQQAQRLRMNGRFISDTAFNMRKAYLIRKETGVLREKVPGAGNPMSNPMAMMDMMKGQMVFMLPNFAMMAFVGYFFSGFVCLKIPFPLPSNHFKLMMQRGVDLSSLDVSYVSSLSWYFLVTFGLNGIMRLLLGSESEFDDAKMMQMQVITLGFGNVLIARVCWLVDPGPERLVTRSRNRLLPSLPMRALRRRWGWAWAAGSRWASTQKTAYKGEREALGIAKHEWLGDKAERQLLGDRYPDDAAAAAIDLSK
jgi:hypothetical protein